MSDVAVSPNWTDRQLGRIERIGNKLPDPFVLFLILFAVVALVSTGMALGDVQVTLPGSDTPTQMHGFFTGEGLAWFASTMVTNFIEFPPLGTVVTILLAVGLAERVGMLQAVIRRLFAGSPRWALPYAIAFVGVTGSVMSDASMVIIPPLAALVFKAAGRHPVAGLIGGFAATGAGYSTSVLVTSLDALFAGITTTVTKSLPDPGTTVTAVSNYYYNVVCAIALTLVAGVVIGKVIEPRIERLGISRDEIHDDGEAAREDIPDELSADERRGLRAAALTAAIVLIGLVLLAVLPNGPLRNESGGYLPKSPLLSSVVFIVFAMFAVPALAYGWRARKVHSASEVVAYITAAVRDMAPFIVLAFVIGQFIALFNWSGIASWIAVEGSDLLKSIGLTGYGAILGFVVLASLLNLFIISGSSMWTLLGAVFVPLFALLGYEPGFIQAAFRVGDSATQVMTPLNPYMIVFLSMLRRYEPKAGLGTAMARMIPFVVPFWVTWVAILTIFYALGLPFGPGLHARM